MSQQNLGLKSKTTGSVECLGQNFPSEDARREHFLKLLATKLKDPEFRRIEGFPTGKDEDILVLSDPPYYTACPNPWFGDFLKAYGTSYDPKTPYHREPFAADVSEGKNHPIYNAHSYHTKVPHRAIMRYLLHYTQPGDVVFDGFCGTGMTGLAAQLCGDRAEVQELGYRVENDGTILNEEGKLFSKIGARRSILNDLSTAATFIAYNYNTLLNAGAFEQEATRILKEVEDELGWMYQTTHTDGKTKGQIAFTVWSQVYGCPECAREVSFVEEALNEDTNKVEDSFPCPHCHATLTKKRLELLFDAKYDPLIGATTKTLKRKPVLIEYRVGRTTHHKKPDASDLSVINKIDGLKLPQEIPIQAFPFDEMWEAPRLKSKGITHTHQLFVNRALHVMAATWRRINNIGEVPLRNCLRALVHHQMVNASIRNTYRPASSFGNRALTSAYYVSAMAAEANVIQLISGSIKRIRRAHESIGRARVGGLAMIGAQSSTDLHQIPDSSLDYIFVDPPFGDNFPYAELNLVAEAWHGVRTQPTPEAIVDRSKVNTNAQKGLTDYRKLITGCFKQAFRILKPGHWMTVEFSNTQASVWNSIQSALQEVGFVVANVSALDKQSGSFNAVTTTTAVKQDLVISAYKPNGGLEARFVKRGETEEGVWDFIKTHLRNLPVVKARGGQLEFIAERDPRILYDRMVAFYVGHSTPVPLSSAEFQVGLLENFKLEDDMTFLPEQVEQYKRKRETVGALGQLSIFVEDEKSAIAWLRNFLKERPSIYSDITPGFMQQLSASWKKWEMRPELRALLEQNFLRYEGDGEVPSQIHSYLSTQFKELRNLAKDHSQLREKAKDRWYVPDPNKNLDVEKLRTKKLLEEFWSYLPAGYAPPALNSNRGDSLPSLTVPVPKIPKGKKLKELRSEAVRVGFKHCYQQKDYQTILVVAEMLPESVIQEDEALQMYYDTAVTRTGGD